MDKNSLVEISKTQIRGGNSMIKKLIVTFSALAIIATSFVGAKATFAADAGVTGGSLSMVQPTVGNFTAVTLNGQIQTTNASIGAFTVSDATGTGNGWNLVIKATTFTDSVKSLTLPTNSLDIALPAVTAQAGASAESTITKTVGKIDNATGVKVMSAALDGGMGTYDVTFPTNSLTLNLQPKDVKAGTYTSTISLTLTTGP
jgi:hypothetical protein